LVLLALFVGLSVFACGSAKSDSLDVSKLPEDVRGDYAIFAQRCSKCHSLARPLTAGITDDEQWVLYVNRMRRQPGSGISMEDQEHILRFLRYFAADLRQKDADKKALPAASSTPPAPRPPPPVAPPSSSPSSQGGGG
jgi:hypothetical protein